MPCCPTIEPGNPFDLRVDADPDRFARAVECVTADPNTDGVLVDPDSPADGRPDQHRRTSRATRNAEGKPIFASWMGGARVLAGEELLNRAGICTFSHPDIAARAFCYLWKYSDNLATLEEVPPRPPAPMGTCPPPTSRPPPRLTAQHAGGLAGPSWTRSNPCTCWPPTDCRRARIRLVGPPREAVGFARVARDGRPGGSVARIDPVTQDACRRPLGAPGSGRRRVGSACLRRALEAAVRQGRPRSLPGGDCPANVRSRRLQVVRGHPQRYPVRPRCSGSAPAGGCRGPRGSCLRPSAIDPRAGAADDRADPG